MTDVGFWFYFLNCFIKLQSDSFVCLGQAEKQLLICPLSYAISTPLRKFHFLAWCKWWSDCIKSKNWHSCFCISTNLHFGIPNTFRMSYMLNLWYCIQQKLLLFRYTFDIFYYLLYNVKYLQILFYVFVHFLTFCKKWHLLYDGIKLRTLSEFSINKILKRIFVTEWILSSNGSSQIVITSKKQENNKILLV